MIHDVVGDLVVGVLDSLVDFLPQRTRSFVMGLGALAVIGMIAWLAWSFA